MMDVRQSAMRRLGGFVYWGEYGDRDDLPVDAEPGDTARVRQKEYVYIKSEKGRRTWSGWARRRGSDRDEDQ